MYMHGHKGQIVQERVCALGHAKTIIRTYCLREIQNYCQKDSHVHVLELLEWFAAAAKNNYYKTVVIL